MRDLVRHVGGIHRWATGHVAERRTERWEVDLDEVVGRWPADADLLSWFREGHARLVETLKTAPADLECFAFLAAPTPLAMWSRRQAHETTIHRVDAEVSGGTVSPITPAVAADGIDELVSCFITRGRGRLRISEPVSLLVDALDTGDAWHVAFAPDERVVTSRERQPATCVLRGSAADLYLLLWNRREVDGLDVSGDRTLLGAWREGIRVRWSGGG